MILGKGIKEAIRPYLFAPFVQADSSVAREYGGTGLGLTICKEIVTFYDGNVDYESVYNEGTTFKIELVLPFAKEDDGIKVNSEKNIFNKNNSDDFIENKLKILVVEDNLVNKKLMMKFLSKYRLDYDIASNGKEGVEFVINNDYDVIFMDCQMPVMDGFEATRTIRELGKKDIRIIAMTAYASEEDKKKCFEAGMDFFITKPVDLNEILEMLKVSKNTKKVKESLEMRASDVLHNKEALVLMDKIHFDYDTCFDLVKTFSNQAKMGFEEIEKCFDSKDYEGIQKILHQLKGAAGAVRMEDIKSKLERAELMLKDKEITEAQEYIEEIRNNKLFMQLA